jgi:hypothetical protein
VGNRPVNFNDPTGHTESCGEDIGNLCEHVDSLLSDYGITTGKDKGALTNQEKWAVLRGAIDIGRRFASVQGGTPRDAFVSVYSNGVNVVKSSQTCQQALKEDCWASTVKNTITIYSNAGKPASPDFRTMFIHEMGHVFDNTVGLGLSQAYKKRIKNITEAVPPWTDMPIGCAGLGFHEGACDNPDIERAYLEQAADMFLGWVDGSFNMKAIDGTRRSNWANLWIGTFVLNPSHESHPLNYGFGCDEDTGAGCQP